MSTSLDTYEMRSESVKQLDGLPSPIQAPDSHPLTFHLGHDLDRLPDTVAHSVQLGRDVQHLAINGVYHDNKKNLLNNLISQARKKTMPWDPVLAPQIHVIDSLGEFADPWADARFPNVHVVRNTSDFLAETADRLEQICAEMAQRHRWLQHQGFGSWLDADHETLREHQLAPVFAVVCETLSFVGHGHTDTPEQEERQRRYRRIVAAITQIAKDGGAVGVHLILEGPILTHHTIDNAVADACDGRIMFGSTSVYGEDNGRYVLGESAPPLWVVQEVPGGLRQFLPFRRRKVLDSSFRVRIGEGDVVQVWGAKFDPTRA